MIEPNFIILYVDSLAASCRFYENLLGKKAFESSANFALFALSSGMMLGIWSRSAVEPPPEAGIGGIELAFPVANKETVDAMHTDWCSRQLKVLQPPAQLDFGYTFLACDPDGHRLRVFAPSIR